MHRSVEIKGLELVEMSVPVARRQQEGLGLKVWRLENGLVSVGHRRHIGGISCREA